ncbi:MAG: DNA repair protein RecO [Cyanobacteriota bacterium]|nr:DNA repair protein RecO [Cyanobacteriota bacterium]
MPEQTVEGLVLSSKPLGEHDRLLLLLSASDGLLRLAAPGARKPRSSLAAAVPLAQLRLQIGGSRGLRRVRQLQVVHHFGSLGERLETLAAAQALAELALALVPDNSPAPELLADLLVQLNRLELLVQEHEPHLEVLAVLVQGMLHQLALGGFALPLQSCAHSGAPLQPPIGDWSWRCSLLPTEGLVIGALPQAPVQLNASELALLQRLPRPHLPLRRDGGLLGPEPVWLHLLQLLECWCREHLGRRIRSLALLRSCYGNMAAQNPRSSNRPS